jgi:outer membrane protein OmpA-like peptidoglycan-associated protein
MKLRSALVAATVLALPVAANAQAVNGIYVGAGAGVNIMQQESVKSVPGSTVTSGKFGSTVGPAAVLSLGYGFGNGLRAEVEASYRYNSLNNASGFGTLSTGGAKEQKFGGMVNVLYDFVGVVPMVQPYVGLGAGYQGVMLQNAYGASALGRVDVNSSTKGAFAYQAILGAAMPIAAAPGLALTAEYRFMGLAGDRSYSATTRSPSGAVLARGNATFNDNYNHSVLFGVRYNFGQTPPPVAPIAAPAPAVTPARSYLVFFDWDKYSLTDRARQIIAEAAANSTKVQYTRIEVNGYTDTSGTPKYNLGLSIRRANAVKAELIKDGVPENAITAKGFGDTVLLVPTGPGVREPQNRRVEIIIR